MSHLVGHSRGRLRYGKVTLSPVPTCWPGGVPWLLRPAVIDPGILSQSLARWGVSTWRDRQVGVSMPMRCYNQHQNIDVVWRRPWAVV